MPTYHIHIQGQVQGVGFRPFVYKLARETGLRGQVSNTMDGVHILVDGDEDAIYEFYRELLQKAPAQSEITNHSLEVVKHLNFQDFEIVESNEDGAANLLLTPDFGICSQCLSELNDPQNRRYGYPFITCINCGPRFSIIRKLPYDRDRTSMHQFEMCEDCNAEYDEPEDRRYYSQTNSCYQCSIELALFDSKGNRVTDQTEGVIDEAARRVKQGKILAIKGIGGYLLLADAANENTLKTLRKRKHRPSKPFALMYPDLTALGEDVVVSPDEQQLFESVGSPIVLLETKEIPENNLCLPLIAPNLKHIGAMRPYTPLFELLLKRVGKPVVATSGNSSGSPIVYQDQNAFQQLSSIADYFVVNNRDIVIPQDDSVVKITNENRQKIILRRSRGHAPTHIHQEFAGFNMPVLAMGAELKSTFSLQHQGNTYISQYLGDLSDLDTQQSYKNTLEHFLKLFNFKPEVILVDKHPLYFSTQHGSVLSRSWGVPLKEVQHHQAHFGAVLAENGLLNTSQPILGVIWDGTGLGDDGQIWGGEFFLYHNYEMERVNSFEYFPHILGDKMAREPRISALSLAYGCQGYESSLRPKFTDQEWELYGKILGKNNFLHTSSVGRLFDGAASILGVADQTSYEGEAAMMLENLAVSGLQSSKSIQEEYFTQKTSSIISTRALINDLLHHRIQGTRIDHLALKFHLSLVGIIKRAGHEQGVKNLAFSGGVFQNALLVDLIISELGKDFHLYFHQKLSSNDENVSFGQIACHIIEKKRKQLEKSLPLCV